MAKDIIVSLSADFSPLREQLARLRVRDFNPVMKNIRDKFMKPAAKKAWAASGLHSRSGELETSITAFAGRFSAGVGVRTTKGRDLVLPKAFTHAFGRKKGSNKRRMNKKTGRLFRKSPWGNIPARPFTPGGLPSSEEKAAKEMIIQFIKDKVG